MDEDDHTYGLIECQCCHDLHDVFQMRVDEYGNCYCDRCMSESIVISQANLNKLMPFINDQSSK